ncbi:M81 family metallopeptidase [Primorskyibacter sp. S187A]|uniref:M81 family metallopeptidase n=1 Tax=Primorskyibacter sp. S187A TaxID=3415130 RepID=UPI003C7E972F
MTRLFMACLSTETNTFSPIPTGRTGYEAYFLRHGTATQEPANLMTESLHLWRVQAEALGWEVIESLTAIAEPAGLTTAATYAAFKEDILNDLRKAGGADVILLSLHGAMVAEGVEDCEGDLTQAVRELCPEAIIGVSLDLHCHLTQALLDASDLVITFKEYPHDDATPRAAELWDLALRTYRGEITPRMALFECRMIGIYLTKTPAMAAFVARMQAEEGRGGVLSVSLSHGFVWADVADVGARMLVVTDDDAELAASKAESLGRAFFELRHDVTRRYPDMAQALDGIGTDAPGKPIVLADMSDNSGAGAPGDSTFVLREILDRGLTDVASGLYFDPMAVAICRDAGEGVSLSLRLGGKTEPASGAPLDVQGRIMAIREGCGQHLGPGLEPMGTAVWLRLAGNVDVVLNNLRVQVYHPEAFTHLGIDLARKRLVVVKSTFHFFTPFAALASEVIFCATPGRVSPDMQALRYTRRDGRYWPRVDNPFDM